MSSRREVLEWSRDLYAKMKVLVSKENSTLLASALSPSANSTKRQRPDNNTHAQLAMLSARNNALSTQSPRIPRLEMPRPVRQKLESRAVRGDYFIPVIIFEYPIT